MDQPITLNLTILSSSKQVALGGHAAKFSKAAQTTHPFHLKLLMEGLSQWIYKARSIG